MTWVYAYLFGLPVIGAAILYAFVPQTRKPPRIYMLLALVVVVPLTLLLTPRGWSFPHYYLVTLPAWGIWLQLGIFLALFGAFFVALARKQRTAQRYVLLAVVVFLWFWMVCVKVV